MFWTYDLEAILCREVVNVIPTQVTKHGFLIIAPIVSLRSLEIVYGRSGRLYGNCNGKLRGDRSDRGDRDRPGRTLLYPGDRDLCAIIWKPLQAIRATGKMGMYPTMHCFVTRIPCSL